MENDDCTLILYHYSDHKHTIIFASSCIKGWTLNNELNDDAWNIAYMIVMYNVCVLIPPLKKSIYTFQFSTSYTSRHMQKLYVSWISLVCKLLLKNPHSCTVAPIEVTWDIHHSTSVISSALHVTQKVIECTRLLLFLFLGNGQKIVSVT